MTMVRGTTASTRRYDYGAMATILLCLAVLVALQSQHRFLIVPYENDFPGFSDRAASPSAALELNGFYPLGYPLLLWLLSQVTGTVFGAAKVTAVGGAAVLAVTTCLLGKALLGERRGLLALAMLVVSPYFWQSAISVGTDMPWAAFQSLALYGCTLAMQRGKWVILAWAGAAAGLAYLMRYTTLVMLPVALAYLILVRPLPRASHDNIKGALALAILFLLVALPQLWTSWQVKGNPFFNLQAKNVWFGIYGGGDWATRWREVPSGIGLLEVFAMGPWRFLGHWGGEFVRWLLYTAVLAVGASLTAYRQAAFSIRLILLGMAGLLALGTGTLLLRRRWGPARLRVTAAMGFLGLYYIIYGLSVALVFVQPRFLLAVLPLILAAGLAVFGELGKGARVRPWFPRLIGLGYLLFALLNTGLSTYHYLGALQLPVSEVSRALQTAGASHQDAILASFPVPYSYHTAYDFRPLSRRALTWEALQRELRSTGAAFLLFEEAYGTRYWPDLMPLLRGEGMPGYLAPIWRQEYPAMALYRVTDSERLPETRP